VKEFTDTERLDWVMNHTGAEWDFTWQTENHWIRYFSESYWHVAEGKNYRECIDSILRGEVKN
jgi:hypothetical protein